MAEFVIDDDSYYLDDGFNDEDATLTRHAIIQRPVGAACDSSEDEARDYARTFVWQFRYESARGRYMRRMLDPDTLAEVLTEWSDYDGDWAASDFIIDDGAQTTRHYFGPGHADVDTNGDWTDQAFAMGNQIGSTELLTDDSGDVVQDWAYTAFGELADLGGTGDTRYRYAGAWGYQTNPEIGTGGVAFPFMHVGYRWYDPETGRFLQRDPIGVRGGLDVYVYVENSPLTQVDPTGLFLPGPESRWRLNRELRKRPRPQPKWRFSMDDIKRQKQNEDLFIQGCFWAIGGATGGALTGAGVLGSAALGAVGAATGAASEAHSQGRL